VRSQVDTILLLQSASYSHTVPFQRFLLGEVIKASSVNVTSLVQFVEESGILEHLDLGTILVPNGTLVQPECTSRSASNTKLVQDVTCTSAGAHSSAFSPTT
jgi:hypothetical protein